MHKVFAAAAALVVIGPIYVALVARRPVLARLLVVFGAGGILLTAALGAASTPASAYRTRPVDAEYVSTVAVPLHTGWEARRGIELTFSAPMDRPSVEAALRVSPEGDYRLAWDAEGTVLAVLPVGTWRPSTIYTVSVGPGARSSSGDPLARVSPVVVFTEAAPTATIAATEPLGDRVTLRSGFRVAFSRPVDLASLRAGFSIEPAVAGHFEVSGRRGSPATVTWYPDASLAPDATYVVTFGRPVTDRDGVAVAEVPRLTVRTAERPAVVRFRPRDREQSVDRSALVSVRFTQPMDQASTEAAFLLSGVDTSKGRFSWAEGDTVLVFDPPAALDYGRAYVMTVLPSARSAAGVPISDDLDDFARSAFRVEAAPAPPSTVAGTGGGTGGGSTGGSGGGTGGSGGTSTAPWLAAEQYLLTLINCTHTGGWVQANGSCRGYGANGQAPLVMDSRIASLVARPWSKYLASTGQLYHGDVGARLAAAGYSGAYWGENLTWYSGSPTAGAIASALFFQGEKGTSYDAHYRVVMDPRFKRVGIGAWVVGGRIWFTLDFWAG